MSHQIPTKRILVASLITWGCQTENAFVPEATVPPSLTVTAPLPATWAATGPTFVTGEATGLASLTVNEQTVEVESDAFVTTTDLVSGLNVIEVVGTEPDGDLLFERIGVLAGTFGDPETGLDEALAVRVNEGGLITVMDQAAESLDADTVESAVVTGEPIYEDSYGVWGWDAVEIAAEIMSIEFDAPQLEIDPTDPLLWVTVAIPNLSVSTLVTGDVVGLEFDIDIETTAPWAVITTALSMEAEDGELVVALEDAEISLDGFAYDTSVLPDEVESVLLVETIQETIEELILEQMETLLPTTIESALSELDTSVTVTLMDRPLTIDTEFAEALVDDDGIEITMDVDLFMAAASSSQTPHVYAGYLTNASTSPDMDHEEELVISISDDLMNKSLFEAWRSGLLDLSLSTDDGSLESDVMDSLHADGGSITLYPQLPPVLIPSSSGDKLLLQLGEILAVVDTPGGDLGDRITIAAHVEAEVDLGVEDGAISLSVDEYDITIVVRDSDWGASDEAITMVLEEALPIDSLLASIDSLSIDLPTLYGVGIAEADVDRTTSTGHSLVNVDLERDE